MKASARSTLDRWAAPEQTEPAGLQEVSELFRLSRRRGLVKQAADHQAGRLDVPRYLVKVSHGECRTGPI